MPVNHAKEFLKFVHAEALFSELFSWTSNGSHCLSFANFLPKLDTVTPEDILIPKMSVCGWISICGFALVHMFMHFSIQQYSIDGVELFTYMLFEFVIADTYYFLKHNTYTIWTVKSVSPKTTECNGGQCTWDTFYGPCSTLHTYLEKIISLGFSADRLGWSPPIFKVIF